MDRGLETYVNVLASDQVFQRVHELKVVDVED